MTKLTKQIERAYISGGGNADKARRFFNLLINNHGKTPGDITGLEVGWCKPDSVPAKPAYQPRPLYGRFGPGAHHVEFGQIDLRKLVGRPVPKGEFCVYGRIHYTDIFREKHYFSFFTLVRANGATSAIGAALVKASAAYTDWT